MASGAIALRGQAVPLRLLAREGPSFALGLVLVLALAADGGGMHATAWGWGALALCWVAGVGIIVRVDAAVSPLEQVMGGALAALAAWTAISAAWSHDAGATMLVTERLLLYVATVVACLALVRGSGYRALLAGVAAGSSLTCCYSLATRLFPERLGVANGLANNRLAAPIGYWNALGLTAAIGIVLCLGLVAYAEHRTVRAVAAASLVPTTLTLYLTFSRGAWLALAVALLATFALDRERARFAAGAVVLAPFPLVALIVAWHARDVVRYPAPGPNAVSQGHHIAVAAALTAAGAAVTGIAMAALTRPVRRSGTVRHSVTGVLAAAAAAVLVAGIIELGSPQAAVHKAWHSFNRPPVALQRNSSLNKRLFTLSGEFRTQLWKVAWNDFHASPVHGVGAGAYQRTYLLHRRSPSQVVNAHNLYAEVLGELGVPGLALLLAALLAPLASLRAARRRELAPVAAGAYVAFLAHNAVDWDWQVPATTVAALLCGCALLVAGRRDARPALAGPLRRGIVGALVAVVAAASLFGLTENRRVGAAQAALARDDTAAAVSHARAAARLASWNARAWQVLGDAQLQRGELAAARRSYRTALTHAPDDWRLWLALASASTSPRARHDAALHAVQLNPLSLELAAVRGAYGLPAK